jgi:hypothetical protein
MRIFVLVISLLLSVLHLQSQELFCRVNIQAPNITGIDKNILNQMQQDITQYMNNRKWSNHNFEPNERIKCIINIVITGLPSADRFEANATIQATRPVYNSTYETVTFNFQDKSFNFNYLPTQNLVFSETNYENNLVTLLNFYAFVILGMDYDTFSPLGGTPFFQRAQNMINLAASSGESGWRAFDGDGRRNRFWLIENLLNNSYKNFRTAIYKYHREGLDKMESDVNAGREKVVEAIEDIQKVHIQNPNIFLTQVFFETKNQELVNILKNAFPEIKQRFLRAVEITDPARMNTYSTINQKQ